MFEKLQKALKVLKKFVSRFFCISGVIICICKMITSMFQPSKLPFGMSFWHPNRRRKKVMCLADFEPLESGRNAVRCYDSSKQLPPAFEPFRGIAACNSFKTTDPAFQTLEEIFISVRFQDLSSVLLLETLQGNAHLSDTSKHKVLLGIKLARGKCKRQSPPSGASEGLGIHMWSWRTKTRLWDTKWLLTFV